MQPQLPSPQCNEQKLLEVEKEHRYFKSRKKNVRCPLIRKLVLRGSTGRNSKSVKVLAREKRKFKMKMIRGKKKVKQDKRREEQNMRSEVNYNIKSSDLIFTNLKDKK